MKKIIWNLEIITSPPVLKHCKKCGRNTEFICSDQFRVNAQRKTLDIWLIYRCSACDTTWNAEVYSRIAPQSLDPRLLERLHCNDPALAQSYALSPDFLRRNAVETVTPKFHIAGDFITPDEAVELEIQTSHFCQIKVSVLIREKLNLSQKAYREMVETGEIKSPEGQDLRKCRLNNGIRLIFHNGDSKPGDNLPRQGSICE